MPFNWNVNVLFSGLTEDDFRSLVLVTSSSDTTSRFINPKNDDLPN